MGRRFDWSLMGVSLSSNAVKLYSPTTGQYCGECRGHSDTVNGISFSGPSSPHVLHSCSSDGTIRAWDTRSFKEVVMYVARRTLLEAAYLVLYFVLIR